MTVFGKGPSRQFKERLIALVPRLRRFALSLTSSQADADDLVQAACERALRKWYLWRPGTRLDSWMFKIVYNLMIDQLRKEGRLRSTGHAIADIYTSIEDQRRTEARLQLQKVQEAMAMLREDERALLSLVCIEGLSYEEAASVLGIPKGTVMSRLSRARKKLHRMVYGK